MEMIQWNPQTLAMDALSDCCEMLDQRKIRHAVRAAHDAAHCSLVALLSNKDPLNEDLYTKKYKIAEL